LRKASNFGVRSDLTVFEEVGMFSVVMVEKRKVKNELSSLATCLGDSGDLDYKIQRSMRSTRSSMLDSTMRMLERNKDTYFLVGLNFEKF
jgi:hypothetical protein